MKLRKSKWELTAIKPGGEEVKQLIRTGGYYHWDWKFPFRHFRKEKLYITTESGIYTYKWKEADYERFIKKLENL